MNDDERWMREALHEAKQCLRRDADIDRNNPQSAIANPQLSAPPDVPVGAICVMRGEIIGRGHNRREIDHDPTAHAEVLAIQAAARRLNNWRLQEVTLYVTLEPCAMCAGTIWLARLSRVVLGAWDERAGACGSLFDIPRDPRLNHRPQLRGGVLADECAALLNDFFASARRDSASDPIQ